MNVIITGASKGIGKAIAAAFAAKSATLFICARDEVRLYDTLAELQLLYPKSIINAMPVDLADKNAARQFGKWCLQSGVPDILINNAGQYVSGSIYNAADNNIEKMISINLYSAYYLTKTLLPKMMETKKGHIFNICSIASLQAYANGGDYSISKFALMGFSKNLREELKPYNIKVTSVYPGAVFTDSWSGFDNSDKRIMEAEDIAKMIVAAGFLSTQATVEDIVIRPQLGDL